MLTLYIIYTLHIHNNILLYMIIQKIIIFKYCFKCIFSEILKM